MLRDNDIVLESGLRQGEEARAVRGGSQDQGTSRLLGAAYGAGLIVMPVLSIVRGRRGVPAALGPIVMLIAIGLRAWAAITLGRFYTRTLRTLADQRVVRSGPYRFVRHPGYLGSLLMWLGFGLSTRDWLAGAAALSAMSGLYLRRIKAEEAMLRQELGEAYLTYMAKTPALLPRPR